MGQSTFSSLPKISRGPRCPVCSAPAQPTTRPFCSTLCADVDLSRWLRGAYAIPGGQQDADEDGEDTQAAQRPGTDDDGTMGEGGS